MSLSGKREGHDIFQFGDPVGEYYAYKEEDVKEFINNQFQIIEELLSVEDAIKLEKEFIKLAGKKLTSQSAEEAKNEI